MPRIRWYRSLYWRIALGFVALLAVLLLAQGFVFLWMTGRMTDFFPSRSPAQLVAAIASDLSAQLAEQPSTDIDVYANGKFSGSSRGFAIAMLDGRTIISQRVPAPPQLARAARARLFGDRFGDRIDRGGRRPGPGPGFGGTPPGGTSSGSPPFGSGDPLRERTPGAEGGPGFGGPGGGRDGFPPFGRGDRGFRGGEPGPPPGSDAEFAQIVVNNSVAGIVAVPREPPPLSVALRDLGPTLAAVALGLLAAGTAVAAIVIVRPTQRRLRELQSAARAIGAGESGVRAPTAGGDEVTSLARTFNDMAGELEARTLALEAADRTRRQLLADVSHELTTPLAAIRGYVETLAMPDVRLDVPTRARYLQIVTDETERLEHIVGDLLDLARLEGGGGSFKMEIVSVTQLLQRVRHRHAPIVRSKNVQLETRQSPLVDLVPGDQNRLEQALQNLVANAIRHAPPGGHVAVTAEPADDGGVRLLVQDNGPGIPPEHLPRIFDRFYKVDESRTGTSVPSGSGLGLSIVRAIVSRHGGTITASNAPEGGARFEIWLPGASGNSM